MFNILQYIAPHHFLTWIVHCLAHSRVTWFKNWAIKNYIRVFNVDLASALIQNPEDYPTLSSFFTRQLKPESRPIVQGSDQIACPVDGSVSQIGSIKKDILIQAKGFDYSLESLFAGNSKLANLFSDGKFATLYLSPKDYHRVHMPVTGHLKTTIFVPGRLFSVNQRSTNGIPNLFSRNERLICLFDTEIGPMTVILVGALLVGTMETVWQSNTKARTIIETQHNNITLQKGVELGRFNMGSTVIVLFAKDKMAWTENLKEESPLKMGQLLATILK